MNDLRLAVRQLIKTPVFTAVAVISIGLGIGANTAIFSVLNAMMLRALQVQNPHELREVKWAADNVRLGSFRSFQARRAHRSRGSAAGGIVEFRMPIEDCRMWTTPMDQEHGSATDRGERANSDHGRVSQVGFFTSMKPNRHSSIANRQCL